MRKNPILFIILITLLLAACQGGTVAQPTASPEPTSPPQDYPAPGAVPPTGEAYPMATDVPGSGPGLLSAYPPAADDDKLMRGNLFIEEFGLLPVQGRAGVATLTLAGSLPTPCHSLRVEVSPPDKDEKIVVDAYTVVDPNMICTQVLKPFSGQVATIAGLPSGSYTVVLNGEEIGKLDVP